MSDSVRPRRQQPTRVPHPWDSPGRNTGVGCRFLLQCVKVKSESKVTQSCPTLSDPMDCSLPGSSSHGIFQARVLEWGAIAFPESYCYPRINGNGDWISPQGIQNVLTILANIYLEVLSQMCLGKFPLKLWINRLERTEGLSQFKGKCRDMTIQ